MVGTDVRHYNGQTFRARMLTKILDELFITRVYYSWTDREQIPTEIKQVKAQFSTRYNKRTIAKIPFIFDLLKQEDKFNILYICGEFKMFPLFIIPCKIKRIKVVFEAESILSLEQKATAGSPFDKMINGVLERFVVKWSDKVIALSEDIQKFYAVYNSQTEVVNAILNKSWFEHSRSDIERKEFFNVGVIGPFNIERNKRELDFIITNLDRFRDGVIFHIFGKYDHQLPSSNKINKIGFIPDYSDYMKRLSNMDAVIVPTSIPTYGPLTKILEPMACGIPVFTTPNGYFGLDHIVKDQDIFVYNLAELVDGFNHSLSDISNLNAVRVRGMQKVRDFYSYEYNKNKLANIIRRM